MQFKMPYNEEAERQILGAIMLDDKTLWTIGDHLSPEDFYSEDHRLIYELAIDLRNQGRPSNTVTLADAIGRQKNLRISLDYLEALPDGVINPRDAVGYAKQVAEHAQVREIMGKMIDGLDRLSKLGPADNRTQAIEEVESLIFDAGRRRQGQGVWLHEALQTLVDDVGREMEEGVQTRGYSWGLPAADEICGLLMPGRQYLVAAMSGFGKSAFGMQAALSVATRRPAVFYSLEMSEEDHALRRFATEADVKTFRIENRTISMLELERMASAARAEAASKLRIRLKTGRMTMAQIRAHAMREKRNHDIGCIVIDHLRLVQPSDKRLKEHEHAMEVTADSKELAKDLNIPVIMLGQLKQADLYSRTNNLPRSSDVYGGGAVEQNMDVMLFLHRPDIFHENQKPTNSTNPNAVHDWEQKKLDLEGMADLITGKRRGGRGHQTRRVRFDAEKTRFLPLDASVKRKSLETKKDTQEGLAL